jgi:CRISPR system Cascade subunit CasE
MYLSRIELNKQNRATQFLLGSPQRIHAAVKACYPENDERQLWRIDKLRRSLYLLVVSPSLPDFRHIKEKYGWAHQVYNNEFLDYSKLFDRLDVGQEFRFKLRANTASSVKPTALQKEEKENRSLWKVFGENTVRFQKEWLLNKSKKSGFEIVKRKGDTLNEHSLKSIIEVPATLPVGSSGNSPGGLSTTDQGNGLDESVSGKSPELPVATGVDESVNNSVTVTNLSSLASNGVGIDKTGDYQFELIDREYKRFNRRSESEERVDKIVLNIGTFGGVLRISDLDEFKRSLSNGIGRAKAYGCGLLTIALLDS